MISLLMLIASYCVLESPALSILRPYGLRLTYLNVLEHGSPLRHWSRRQTTLWSSSSTDTGAKRPFDPIEDDPRLHALYLSEIKAIRSTMTTSDMKTELSSTGNPSKSVMDKAELEKLLARRRILFRMQNAQQTEIDLKNQQQRAERIDNEIYQITRVTRMSEIAIVRELQSLQCKVNVNGNLAQQLAVARLGLHRRRSDQSNQTTTSTSNSGTPKAATVTKQEVNQATVENKSDRQDDGEFTLGDEVKGAYNRLRSTFDEAMDDIVGDVNLDDLNPINILSDVIKNPENLNPLRDVNVLDIVANTTLGQRINVTAAATFSKGLIIYLSICYTPVHITSPLMHLLIQLFTPPLTHVLTHTLSHTPFHSLLTRVITYLLTLSHIFTYTSILTPSLLPLSQPLLTPLYPTSSPSTPPLSPPLTRTPRSHSPANPFSEGFINGVGLTRAEQRAQLVIAQQTLEGTSSSFPLALLLCVI